MKWSKYIIYLILFNICNINAQSDDVITISLSEFLDNYSNESGIQFAYNPEHFNQLKIRKDDFRSIDLEELIQLLDGLDLDHIPIEQDRWLLKKRKKAEPEKQVISLIGQVLDDESNPLVNALMYTSDMKYSALTDTEGKFTLNFSEFQATQLCCQFLGYELNCINIGEAGLDEINFELIPKAEMLDQVEIKAKRIKINIQQLQDAETIYLSESGLGNASLGKDVLRSVQLLSGVDATNDASSALRIRSSSQFQSLITLDGIPVYNPESAFGIFSSINPLVVERSSLYKNALPLDYGEFTGAYLACTGKSGIDDKIGLKLDINTLSSAVALNLPLSEKFQVNAAIRTSNGAISNKQFYSKIASRKRDNNQGVQQFTRPELLDTELENRFKDAYLNFLVEPNDMSSFSFSAFYNNDQSGSSFSDSNPFTPANGNTPIIVEESFNNQRKKENLGFSFNYISYFKNDSKFLLRGYSTSYSMQDSVFTRVSFIRPNRVINNFFRSNLVQDIRDSGLKLDYRTEKDQLINYTVGLDIKSLEVGLDYKTKNQPNVGFTNTVPSFTPYLGIQLNKNELFYLDIGSRLAVIPSKELLRFWSPRIQAGLKIFEGAYLKSSISHNEQYFRPIEIEQQLGQSVELNILANSNNVPILVSNQLTLGFSYSGNKWKINSDFYVRSNEGILQQVLVQPGVNNEQETVFENTRTELIQGNNRVAGFDFTAFYEKGSFNSLLSYTYSKSQDQFSELFQNDFLPAQNNRTHQWNAHASYDLKNWNFNSTLIYGSGMYILNRGIIEENIIRQNIDPNTLFKQLPAYRRLDLGISYKLPIKKLDLHLDFNVFNVFNNNNIQSEIYIYKLVQDNLNALGAAEINLLNRVVSLGIRVDL